MDRDHFSLSHVPDDRIYIFLINRTDMVIRSAFKTPFNGYYDNGRRYIVVLSIKRTSHNIDYNHYIVTNSRD